ncbi:hypothetical protein [Streptomyces luteireticuli]|uniref:hypothetical protein n=1 Tax=Streptomyces luteireticuli TaxID=173858 RepID=UPI0035578EF7
MSKVTNSITGGVITGAVWQGEDMTVVGGCEHGRLASSRSGSVAEDDSVLTRWESHQIADMLRHYATLDGTTARLARSWADELSTPGRRPGR